MKKILVTGANGFIGQSLCSDLVKRGYFVRGTVRSRSKIEQCLTCSEHIIVDDIGPETFWDEVLKDIDIVIHLAARVHVMKEKASDALFEYRKVNLEGTKRLSEKAANAGVQKFIYLSTVKVNGEKTHYKPFTEEDLAFPEDEYGISKMEAEQALRKIADATSMQIIVLRIPLVYGPGVKGNFLRLLDLVKKGIPLPFANLTNKRSFLYLGNLVSAISICIDVSISSFEIFLVNDDRSFSTTELIELIASKMKKHIFFIPVPLVLIKLAAKILKKTKEVDRLFSSLVIDGSKIRNSLKWQPPFTAENGIDKTVLWYNK